MADRYRKKPVEVEAVATDTAVEGRRAIAAWCGGRVAEELPMLASNGDWIIREPFPTDDRKFYPSKPDIFEATYKRVGDHLCTPPMTFPTSYGQKWDCTCGRRWVVRHGDGLRTPPRLYWKRVRRLHVRRYRVVSDAR